MTDPLSETRHATTVAIGGRAVLIQGRSGEGKSDLAMRLIDRGAVLVSDDRTEIRAEAGQPVCHAPVRMAGKIEVRGLGIVAVPHVAKAPLALLVRLGREDERLPEPARVLVLGSSVPAMVVDPFRPSAPIKVEWALRGADMMSA